jgi:hypothetical protein
VLRGDAKLLAPEETPEEVLREREQRAASLAAVQDKLKAAGAAGGFPELIAAPCLNCLLWQPRFGVKAGHSGAEDASWTSALLPLEMAARGGCEETTVLCCPGRGRMC